MKRIRKSEQVDWVTLANGDPRGRMKKTRAEVPRCMACGRPLLSDHSRAVGLGPVCRGERPGAHPPALDDTQTGDLLSPLEPGADHGMKISVDRGVAVVREVVGHPDLSANLAALGGSLQRIGVEPQRTPVIFRDTVGQWFGVVFNRNQFMALRPLEADSYPDAIRSALPQAA